MDQYRKQRSEYDIQRIHADQKEKPVEPPPPSPDFEKLAKQHGLSAGRTGLIPLWEAQGSEIGKSSLGDGRTRVWQYAYQTLAEFRPEMSIDLQGNCYLFWKTDEKRSVFEV